MILILPLFAALIPSAPPQVDLARIQALILALGDPDFDARNAAQRALRENGFWAEKPLRDNLKNPDAEIASRCRELLLLLEEQRRDVVRGYSGKIALVDSKGRRIATDVRRRDGIIAGDRLKVTRLGQKVGVLVVADVQVWGSWVIPESDGSVDDFQKGDVVELLKRR